MPKHRRLSATAAFAAAVSLVATPVAALDLPRSGPTEVRVGYDADAESVAHGRRWGHRDRVDAGDIIAGVLILGGIAAVASAASRSREPVDPYPSRYPYPEDPRYRESQRGWESSGLEGAVDMCVAEVERERARVVSVDSASRGVGGWFVSGEVEGDALFTCRIDNDGRIQDVEIGSDRVSYSAQEADGAGYGDPYGDDFAADAVDAQYEDEVYLRARADLGAAPEG